MSFIMFSDFVLPLYVTANMSQSIVCDSSCEDTTYLIDIKEELLDVASATDIDSIKHDRLCATMKDEIDIKEEPLNNVDEFDLNFDIRNSEPLKSSSKVCGIKHSIDILLPERICIDSLFV